MSTFAAVGTKSRFVYSDYASVAEGALDKTAEGLRFTRILDAEKTESMLALAKKHCIASNSLREPVELQATVVSSNL